MHNLRGNKSFRRKLRNNLTVHEIVLWKYLRNSHLGYKFRRQQSIGAYIVDFCCPKKKLIIELDGSQHIDAKHYDERRTLYLNRMGYRVMRFWDNEVTGNIEEVLLVIKSECEKPTPPSAPLPGKGGETAVV